MIGGRLAVRSRRGAYVALGVLTAVWGSNWIGMKLALARADGRYPKLLRDYAKTQLLILDDWGLAPLTAEGRRDLLELLEDRYNHQSTVVTSQLPVATWHAYLNEPTLADAILDRLVHNAYTLNLTGESMRKRQTPLTNPTTGQ